jgi:hypothetical protein
MSYPQISRTRNKRTFGSQQAYASSKDSIVFRLHMLADEETVCSVVVLYGIPACTITVSIGNKVSNDAFSYYDRTKLHY